MLDNIIYKNIISSVNCAVRTIMVNISQGFIYLGNQVQTGLKKPSFIDACGFQ